MQTAASIAGLVTLAGFVLQSTRNLHTFLRDVRHVDDDVSRTLDELSLLSDVLKHVQSNTSEVDFNQSKIVDRFHAETYKCGTEIEVWRQKLEKKRRKSSNIPSNLVKNAGNAFQRNLLERLRSRIAVHREQIGLLLSLLVKEDTSSMRSFEGRTFQKLQVVQQHQLRSTTDLKGTMQGIREDMPTQASLMSIERRMQTPEERIFNELLPEKSRTPTSRLGETGKLPTPDEGVDRSCLNKDRSFGFAMAKQNSDSVEMLLRLVKIGKLVQEENCHQSVDLVALPDRIFDRIDVKAKTSMIKQLQGLRLVIWLLQEEHLLSGINYPTPSPSCTSSAILREGNLAARQSLSITIKTKQYILIKAEVDLIGLINLKSSMDEWDWIDLRKFSFMPLATDCSARGEAFLTRRAISIAVARTLEKRCMQLKKA